MTLAKAIKEIKDVFPSIRVEENSWENGDLKSEFGIVTFDTVEEALSRKTSRVFEMYGLSYYMKDMDPDTPTYFVHDDNFILLLLGIWEDVAELVLNEPDYLQESDIGECIHQYVQKMNKLETYFKDPYSPWDKKQVMLNIDAYQEVLNKLISKSRILKAYDVELFAKYLEQYLSFC